jgi:hypothetical protein
MKRIVFDQKALNQLPYCLAPVELVDASGTVLGVFTPDPAQVAAIEPPPLKEEEIRRRMSEPGGRTWKEIRADLERRG